MEEQAKINLCRTQEGGAGRACGLNEKQIVEGPLSRPRPVPNEPLEQVIVSLLLPLRYLSDWLNHKKSGC